MEENNTTPTKKFSTYLANVNDAFMPLIERQMASNSIEFSEYSKKCVMNAIGAINQMLDANGLNFKSEGIDQSNITNILLDVAYLELNAISQPSECYFTIRNVKRKDGTYKKMIEFSIQGDGFDAILSRFGRNVKKVYPHWLVRENDYFEYPQYNGLEYTPPIWKPQGAGNVVRIVYPILHTDNTIHYYIGERDDVLRNLMAHINNNLMNEAFGIAENRYKATAEQLKKINAKKSELKARAKQLGWGVLDDDTLAPFISPSWKEDFSRESMIIRKIRNNIVKKIPKDFGSPAVLESYSESSDDGYKRTKDIIESEVSTIQIEAIAPQTKADAPQSSPESVEDTEGGENKIDASEPPVASESENVDLRVKPSFD